MYGQAIEHRLESFKDQARLHGVQLDGEGSGAQGETSGPGVVRLPSADDWKKMSPAEAKQKEDDILRSFSALGIL